jgi:uncharacterized protein (TIRG00374 family)
MTSGSARRLLDWKAALGIAISIAALYYVFRDQDLGALVGEVRRADPFYFALATVAATGVFWIRAWRWKALLDSVRPDTTFRSRFAATTIGFMGNNLFPARVGEFMRPLALARAEQLPVVSCFTSLVLERMFDALTVIALLFLSTALPGLPGFQGAEPHTTRAVFVGVAMIALLAVLVPFVIWPDRAVRGAERVVGRLPERVRRPIIDSLEAFLKGAGALRDPVLLLRAGGWSLVLWLFNAFGFWLAFRAFDLPFSFTAALFFQGMLVIAVAIPSAPGFFGLYEGMAKIVLVGMWSADTTKSMAFASAYHIAGFIPVTLIGLYYANRLGISAQDAAASETQIEEAVEAGIVTDGSAHAERRP